MKSIMISIKPKRCELIENRNETIEVRKTKPKCGVPFKCYIYCTMDNAPTHPKNYLWKEDKTGRLREIYWNGKIIGEFICDNTRILFDTNGNPKNFNYDILPCILKETGLTFKEFQAYTNSRAARNHIYGWHISDLKIYDKPKKLVQFFHDCGENPNCENCEFYYFESNESGKYEECCSPLECYKPLARPPQSWCYVERYVE